ncbi:hypothetical protein C4A77_06010 [Brevibacillus laterosporus]|uniref:Helix-turn-helix domain-containing protein n=1 Tax=Brevibacillus laterosporus TaxID=1465 RepID=A0AAP8QER5_BRELA|nr:hypothetical protein C4A77_06010 [Brevibacillus laterosporus]
MATRVSYPMEIKMKAVEMRLAGIPVKEVMDQLCIKNKTQLKTWMRWYRNGETHRFEQPVGKQYTYGKGGVTRSSSSMDERDKGRSINAISMPVARNSSLYVLSMEKTSRRTGSESFGCPYPRIVSGTSISLWIT